MQNEQGYLDRPCDTSVCKIACIAGAFALFVFVRSVTCGFVNVDDPDYVLNNALIRGLDWDHILAAFTTSHAGFWMPLTWISFAIDYQFWGLNPAGYHVTNVLLHSLNTALVVVVADRLMRDERREAREQGKYIYPATLLLSGLVWGLHPLRVESVAWVTERKDVLNGFLFLCSMLFYLRYAQGRNVAGDRFRFDRDYALSLLFFIMSLMAKPISVFFPFVLLVIDWYPLRRLRRTNIRSIIGEKILFLVCSGAMVAATLLVARQSNILASFDNLSVLQRLAVSGNALFEYCRFLLYPAGILPLHVIDASQMTVYALKGVAFVVVSAFVAYVLRKNRWPVAAMACFIVSLLPVLALFQNGIQAFASRFTYLPSLAPSIVAAFLAGSICQKNDGVWHGYTRVAIFVAGVALIVAYGVTSWRFIGSWKSTETVWSRIIDIQPTGRAFKERGLYYLSIGHNAAAEQDLTASIPYAQRAGLDEIYMLYAFRGVALLDQDRYQEAVEDFSRAISLCPDPRYLYHRGRALIAIGKTREAEADFLRSGGADGPIEWGVSVCR